MKDKNERKEKLRKQLDKKLRISESKYRGLIEKTGAAV